MYDLLVTGHYPSINEKDIPRNATIEIYLNDTIDTTTVKYNNIVVVDNLYNTVKGHVGFDYTNKGTPSGVATILTFTPDAYLDPETSYSIYVNKYPDSVKSIHDKFLQDTYTYSFSTGIGVIDNTSPTYEEQLRLDLEAAIKREDWCEAARIQAILDGDSDTCGIPSGIPDDLLPEYLILANTVPGHMDSDIPLDKLRFIKLQFNDIMPASGIDYNSYISVVTKNVLE
jgi:hypothetical protein